MIFSLEFAIEKSNVMSSLHHNKCFESHVFGCNQIFATGSSGYFSRALEYFREVLYRGECSK